MTDPKFRSFIIATLRRASYRWFGRSEALKLARVERGMYTCAMCKGVFKKKDTQLDHIQPIIDPKEGFVDWNTYIPRLFCAPELYQVLCRVCHKSKTFTENSIRKEYKRKKKLDKANDS